MVMRVTQKELRQKMTKEKLAVTIWNYNGGVGKTTISLILSQIAARQGLNVLAIDLDEQRNLSETLKLSKHNFPSITVHTELKPAYHDNNYDFFVIDTHPSKDETVKSAMQFADIVLVPILTDYLSIINLRSVFDYVKSCGVGEGQIAVVKNSVTEFKVSEEIEQELDEQGYTAAGRLPRSNILVRNIANGDSWDKFMRPNQREPFARLYARVWKAFMRMLAGEFHNIWRD